MYQKQVVKEIEKLGQTARFGWWALDQVDVEHYHRKYEAAELAELLVSRFAGD